MNFVKALSRMMLLSKNVEEIMTDRIMKSGISRTMVVETVIAGYLKKRRTVQRQQWMI